MNKKGLVVTGMLTGLAMVSMADVKADDKVNGCLDKLEITGSTINLEGWAYDLGLSNESVMIQVCADSNVIASVPADQIRDDVMKEFNIQGNHGFSSKVETNLTGAHTIEVYALDTSKSTRTLLGKTEFQFGTSQHLPVGSVDHLSVSGSTLRVSGWAIDQDSYSSAIQVQVYSDGTLIKTLDRNINRKDVSKFFGIEGTYGFSDEFDTGLTGEHVISIYAVDLNGIDTTLLSSRKVTFVKTNVVNQNAIGCVDHIAVNGSSIKLSGWALDRDSLDEALVIQVYSGEQLIGELKTGNIRSDVNKFYKVNGNFGFAGQLNTSLVGTQPISVYVVDPQTNKQILLTQTTLTFASTGENVIPIGCVDVVKVQDQKITVAGWAFDKDAISENVNVEVYLDKEYVGSLSANQTRDDVNKVYSITGKHGFSGIIKTTLTGSKTVYLYAVDINTKVKVLIGQQNIMINSAATTNATSANYITGWVDFVDSPANGLISVQGWCFDSKNTTNLLDVTLYIDEQYMGKITTTDYREDVNNTYNISGFHGYSGQFKITQKGTHTIKVYVADSNGNNLKLIGTKTVDVSNKDLFSIAYTQLGVLGGSKYNRWYGISDSSAWCAAFVSWCADQQGILNTKVPKFCWCGNAVSWYKNRGLWLSSGATPKRNDLIFFDFNKDGVIDHVGIVEKVNGGRVYTIEGNNSNQVKTTSYPVSYTGIYGYGVVD